MVFIKVFFSSGIKLFASSTKYVLTDEEVDNINQRKRKKKYSSSSDDSSDEEKFAEAAVSHDFIMKESGLLNHDSIETADDKDKRDTDSVENKIVLEKYENVNGKSLTISSSKSNCKKKKKKKKKEKYDIT